MACRFIWYIPLGTTSGNPSKWNRRGWMLERESETKKITLNFRRHSSLPWLLIPCNEIILTFYHIMKLLIETKVVVICHCDYFWHLFLLTMTINAVHLERNIISVVNTCPRNGSGGAHTLKVTPLLGEPPPPRQTENCLTDGVPPK